MVRATSSKDKDIGKGKGKVKGEDNGKSEDKGEGKGALRVTKACGVYVCVHLHVMCMPLAYSSRITLCDT